jgi:hypothetical protein
MRRPALVIASLVAGLAGSLAGAGDAAAQPGQTPVTPPVAQPGQTPITSPAGPPVVPPALASGGAAPRPAPERGELSESMALGLSLGVTTVSWGTLLALGYLGDGDGLSEGSLFLCGLGTFLGPSIGHVYAGKLATRGLGIRALGVLVATVAFLKLASNCEGCDDSEYEPWFWAGAAVYFAGSLDDIITAPLRARRHNRRLERERAQRLTGVTLAPLALPGPRGGLAGLAGLALSGRF